MSNNVKTHATLCIYLEISPEKSITVGDVRRWLNLVDSYGISDTTELTTAVLDLDIDSSFVESIECGNCAPQSIRKDALMVMHKCSPSMTFNYASYSEIG